LRIGLLRENNGCKQLNKGKKTMKVEVKIMRMGANSDEATFHRWLKNEGEQVQEGDPIAELETDKVNFELEAPAAGVLTDRTLST